MRGEKMKKRKVKKEVKILIVVCVMLVSVISATTLLFNKTQSVTKVDSDFTYVNDYIFDNYYPVVSNEETIIRPYTSDKVTLYKNFYEKDANKDVQQNSIIYYEGIYMQNSGVDYKSDESFDIVSSLSGTVTNITDDPLLGKTIEIRNSTEIVFMYQSLGEVLVKKGDIISQGDIIAKSGTCSINNDITNSLHFEIYKNGTVINPEKYFDKSIKELINN